MKESNVYDAFAWLAWVALIGCVLAAIWDRGNWFNWLLSAIVALVVGLILEAGRQRALKAGN